MASGTGGQAVCRPDDDVEIETAAMAVAPDAMASAVAALFIEAPEVPRGAARRFVAESDAGPGVPRSAVERDIGVVRRAEADADIGMLRPRW